MTFTISKKDFIYSTVIVVLIIVSSVSFLSYKASAQQGGSFPSGTKTSGNSTLPEGYGSNTFDATSATFTHPSCRMSAIYLLPSSTTYVPNAQYETAFMSTDDSPTISTLQDINGDNLPDYLYSYSRGNVVNNIAENSHYGCIYLNNGAGWTKAYRCFATTRKDLETGNITNSEYRGDCAGSTASSKEEGMISENSDKQ